jgi:hypothetical protein
MFVPWAGVQLDPPWSPPSVSVQAITVGAIGEIGANMVITDATNRKTRIIEPNLWISVSFVTTLTSEVNISHITDYIMFVVGKFIKIMWESSK